MQKEVSKSISFSVVVPAYELAPKSQYPTQLKQAAETLASLLQEGKKPGDVSVLSSAADVKPTADSMLDRPCWRLSGRPYGVVADLAPIASALRCPEGGVE